MQRAYITFATISSVHSDKGAIKSRWADQVVEAATQHGNYVEDFAKGKFYPNIAEDPRDSVESDEKISLSGYAGYSSQKTLAPQSVKQNEQKMSEDAEKVVKDVI